MTRIYYKEEKLSGESIQHKFINVALFDYIFNSTNTNNFELKVNSKLPLPKAIKTKLDVFKNVQIVRDDLHYNTEEGDFYLPNSIVFTDNNDFSFPTEFYFISKIGEQIELRKCNGGEDVKWYQIPILHQSVQDKNVILKVKNTLKRIKKLVATTHNKKIEEELKQKELERKRKIEEMRPLLTEKQKEAYRELVSLCVQEQSSKTNIVQFIETLKNYDNDEEYLTTFNYFLEFLENEDHNFIIRLDWKSEVEDLEWSLKSSLKQNYDEVLKLPKHQDYNANTTVSHEGVLEDYIKPLRLIGLQLGIIDTKSDEYILLLHKQEDKEKLKIAVEGIGYTYHEKV
ncbi:DUF6630 family protein [Tenacibaculum jejuense]|uniref:DUF6630 domain-containing protein n=1 Tax=Tenacibaculum jejuense TaxID=584609 RepID=A0A238UAL7_9FLAO|nr:hypothetical protein [Tenacibaculum jejuense]SNR16221.1 Protein of unknown function [Tenacibaculum jejuense]